jgi:hypothetical protein
VLVAAVKPGVPPVNVLAVARVDVKPANVEVVADRHAATADVEVVATPAVDRTASSDASATIPIFLR